MSDSVGRVGGRPHYYRGTYAGDIARLTEAIRRRHQVEVSVTKADDELGWFAQVADRREFIKKTEALLAAMRANRHAALLIATHHDYGDERQPSQRGYFEIIDDLETLLRTARSSPTPDPRRRTALYEACLAFLTLRYEHGLPAPTAYESNDAFQELVRICECAGVPSSESAVRKALARALKRFDGDNLVTWCVL